MRMLSLSICETMFVTLLSSVASCSSDKKGHTTTTAFDTLAIERNYIESVAAKDSTSPLNKHLTAIKRRDETTQAALKEASSFVNEVLETPTAYGIRFSREASLDMEVTYQRTIRKINSVFDTPSSVWIDETEVTTLAVEAAAETGSPAKVVEWGSFGSYRISEGDLH